jgi:hypothetical protein
MSKLVEEALFKRLSTTAAVIAIVPASRIVPVVLPQQVILPALTYQKLGAERVNNLKGSSGVASSMFQIDTWAETYKSAKLLNEQVRLALADYQGTGETIKIHNIEISGEQDVFEENQEFFRIILRIKIWHEEARAVS